jgi:hypothetical protein
MFGASRQPQANIQVAELLPEIVLQEDLDLLKC